MEQKRSIVNLAQRQQHENSTNIGRQLNTRIG